MAVNTPEAMQCSSMISMCGTQFSVRAGGAGDGRVLLASIAAGEPFLNIFFACLCIKHTCNLRCCIYMTLSCPAGAVSARGYELPDNMGHLSLFKAVQRLWWVNQAIVFCSFFGVSFCFYGDKVDRSVPCLNCLVRNCSFEFTILLLVRFVSVCRGVVE
jgi:hypothetical protein